MFACLVLPGFRLQAALRWQEPRGAAVVVDSESLKGVVLEANTAAEARGISPGMTSSQAMARDSHLLIRPRSPDQEACLNQLLLDRMFGLSPQVELTRDGTCLADLRQASRTVCWQQLADGLVAQLASDNLHASVGIAPTPDLADLAAQSAQPTAVVYDAAAFTKTLPVEELHPSAEMAGILQGWGIRTVGDFLALPKADSIDRLGSEAERLLRKVSGRHHRPLRLVRTTPVYAEAFDFEYEVETVEPILFLLRRFLETLCQRLGDCHRVVSGMDLRLTLEGRSKHQRFFQVPSPTSAIDVLFRILHTHLENLRLDQRPVGIRLELQASHPARDQLQLFESTLRDPNRFGETLARLKAFLGNDRMGVPVQGNSHRPDHFTLQESFDPTGDSVSQAIPLGLPLRRFRPAVRGTVEIANGRPVTVTSAAITGVIGRADGPYCLSGNWWDTESWATEEWDVELVEGGLYRLSRQAGRWLVEGCYEE